MAMKMTDMTRGETEASLVDSMEESVAVDERLDSILLLLLLLLVSNKSLEAAAKESAVVESRATMVRLNTAGSTCCRTVDACDRRRPAVVWVSSCMVEGRQIYIRYTLTKKWTWYRWELNKK
jgi:hypothetical protein